MDMVSVEGDGVHMAGWMIKVKDVADDAEEVEDDDEDDEEDDVEDVEVQVEDDGVCMAGWQIEVRWEAVFQPLGPMSWPPPPPTQSLHIWSETKTKTKTSMSAMSPPSVLQVASKSIDWPDPPSSKKNLSNQDLQMHNLANTKCKNNKQTNKLFWCLSFLLYNFLSWAEDGSWCGQFWMH